MFTFGTVWVRRAGLIALSAVVAVPACSLPDPDPESSGGRGVGGRQAAGGAGGVDPSVGGSSSSAGGDSGGGGDQEETDPCGVSGGDGSSCDCASSLCQAIVSEHNAIRAAVNLGTYFDQPKAEPPIPMLVWDPLIAERAQAYADGVDDFSQGHSSQAFRTYESTYHSGYHGENMAIGGGDFADPRFFVREGWGASEAQDCTLSSCGGHYTQIVWRATVAVGCGRKDNVSFSGNVGTLTVCQYGPGGNISGRDPY